MPGKKLYTAAELARMKKAKRKVKKAKGDKLERLAAGLRKKTAGQAREPVELPSVARRKYEKKLAAWAKPKNAVVVKVTVPRRARKKKKGK